MATWNCESCNRGLRAADAMIGRPMRCPFCEHVQDVPGGPHASVVLVPPPPRPVPAAAPPRSRPAPGQSADKIVITNEDLRHVRLLPPTHATVPPTVTEQRRRAQEVLRHQTTVKPKDWIDEDKCPYCLCDLDPGQHVVVCPECGLAHHADCWAENEGCCTFGCKLAPLRSSLAPPAAAPAQQVRPAGERRRCPNCGRFLPYGETRCRHCARGAAADIPRDGPSLVRLAKRAFGRAVWAIVWAAVMTILLAGVLPAAAARFPLSLMLLAPGFVAAVSAIRKASSISSVAAAGSGLPGSGWTAMATVLGILAILLSFIAFSGSLARGYG